MIVSGIVVFSVLLFIPNTLAYQQRKRCSALAGIADTFSKTCECDADWNVGICDVGRQEPLETVCVCRTYHSERGQCDQYVTKCYHNSSLSSGCSCCFWQDRKHCNQLPCREMSPDVGDSQTKCSCFEDFSIVQEQVCAHTDDQDLDESQAVPVVIFRICGVAFTYTHLVIIISGVFLTVLLITCFLLCLTRYQIDKQRTQKFERREKARQSLLTQKQDEDNYLP
ncbi:hypothetical protein QR680_001785 [Steinernema hermaphroditum]|uniref:EB domain-containing protein n=1 Tax=Steinernema hermaphroditum TaxID=289476 RepID=A0AA39H2P4_9BILA|nr:hypothetical protein QR680_001785 [Steinernema hermaphroditum]